MRGRLFTLSLVLCIAVVVLWVREDRRSIRSRLESRIAAGVDSFDFAAETSFAWDRMFVFGPYSNRADVENSLGFEWPGFRRTTIGSSDFVCLIVFVKDKRVVHWYEQPRAIELGWLANDKGYGPSEARFEVDRSSGRAELRKATISGEPTTRRTR